MKGHRGVASILHSPLLLLLPLPHVQMQLLCSPSQ